MAALILVMGAAAMPTHQKLTSQTDDVIPQPMRGHHGHTRHGRPGEKILVAQVAQRPRPLTPSHPPS